MPTLQQLAVLFTVITLSLEYQWQILETSKTMHKKTRFSILQLCIIYMSTMYTHTHPCFTSIPPYKSPYSSTMGTDRMWLIVSDIFEDARELDDGAERRLKNRTWGPFFFSARFSPV